MMNITGPEDGTVIMRLHRPRVRMPFLDDLRAYPVEKFRRDLVAAVTLTLVSIPQAVAFAIILGLPPTALIVSTVIGGFVGSLFFSSRHHIFGPTTSTCIITAAAIAANSSLDLPPLVLAAYLAFLMGTAQLATGLLGIGDATKFISRSVVVAYSTAIGVLLVASQLHNFLRFYSPAGESLLLMLSKVARSFAPENISWWNIGIGAMTWLVFELVKRLRPKWPESLVGLVFAAAVARLVIYLNPHPPFQMVKDVGMLRAVLPTLGDLPAWQEQLVILPKLASTAIAIAIIGMLEATAVTKTLAARSGQRLDPNQELIGMGAGNLAAGLFGVPPGSASFTRSAVNFQSGAATQLSSMLCSGFVLLVLFVASPAFNYIPVAALAAQLIRTGCQLIDRSQIRIATQSTRSDAVVFYVTLATALLLKLDTAIFVGIAVAVALFLQKTSTPTLTEYTLDESGELAALFDKSRRANPQICLIHVEGELFFGAADLFSDQIRRQAEDENIRVFILRMKNARHLDATTVMAMSSLHDYLRQTGRHLIISGCSADVLRVLRNSGLLKIIGEENVFPGESNPTLATKRALQRAQEILPGSADVRIFTSQVSGENQSKPGLAG